MAEEKGKACSIRFEVARPMETGRPATISEPDDEDTSFYLAHQIFSLLKGEKKSVRKHAISMVCVRLGIEPPSQLARGSQFAPQVQARAELKPRKTKKPNQAPASWKQDQQWVDIQTAHRGLVDKLKNAPADNPKAKEDLKVALKQNESAQKVVRTTLKHRYKVQQEFGPLGTRLSTVRKYVKQVRNLTKARKLACRKGRDAKKTDKFRYYSAYEGDKGSYEPFPPHDVIAVCNPKYRECSKVDSILPIDKALPSTKEVIADMVWSALAIRHGLVNQQIMSYIQYYMKIFMKSGYSHSKECKNAFYMCHVEYAKYYRTRKPHDPQSNFIKRCYRYCAQIQIQPKRVLRKFVIIPIIDNDGCPRNLITPVTFGSRLGFQMQSITLGPGVQC